MASGLTWQELADFAGELVRMVERNQGDYQVAVEQVEKSLRDIAGGALLRREPTEARSEPRVVLQLRNHLGYARGATLSFAEVHEVLSFIGELEYRLRPVIADPDAAPCEFCSKREPFGNDPAEHYADCPVVALASERKAHAMRADVVRHLEEENARLRTQLQAPAAEAARTEAVRLLKSAMGATVARTSGVVADDSLWPQAVDALAAYANSIDSSKRACSRPAPELTRERARAWRLAAEAWMRAYNETDGPATPRERELRIEATRLRSVAEALDEEDR